MTPPRFSRLVLGWLAPREVRETLLDDLDEMFMSRAAHDGPRRARAWYRRQVDLDGGEREDSSLANRCPIFAASATRPSFETFGTPSGCFGERRRSRRLRC